MRTVPENRRLQTESDITEYVYQKFFRCYRPFLSWLKKGETYWFEYQGNGKYVVRSDNNLGENFKMTIHQLLTCFIPCVCEEDETEAFKYFHWIGELGIHHGYIDEYINIKRSYI